MRLPSWGFSILSFLWASLALTHCPLALGIMGVCSYPVLQIHRGPDNWDCIWTLGCSTNLNFWTQYKSRDSGQNLSFPMKIMLLGREYSTLCMRNWNSKGLNCPGNKWQNEYLNPGLWLQCLIILQPNLFLLGSILNWGFSSPSFLSFYVAKIIKDSV